MKKIIILCLLLFSFSLFAEDTPALKDKNGIIILGSEWSEILFNGYNSGDTFDFGFINDNSQFNISQEDGYIKEYLGVQEATNKTLKTFENNPTYQVNDEWLFNNETKNILLKYKWYFKSSKYNKPVLNYIIKSVVKK